MFSIGPAVDSFAITASDSTSVTCTGLYVGGTGTVIVKHNSGDAAVTYTGVPAGAILPLRLRDGRIMAASSATGIVGMVF